MNKIKDKILQIYKKIFKKEENNISSKPNKDIMDFIYDKTNSPTAEMMNRIDYNVIGKPEIINPEQEKTILLLDDIPYTQLLYLEDAKKIKEEYGLDVHKDFKIVRCLGPNAGFLAYKYFVIDKNKCDYGILDITLGHRVNVTGSWFMELDGIDIANYITKLNPNFKFLLCTAHTINKNSDRYKKMYELINQ